jgi:hypothetical protein
VDKLVSAETFITFSAFTLSNPFNSNFVHGFTVTLSNFVGLRKGKR